MAYLSNLIVAGNSKFLNKIYAEDLEVSGAFGATGNVSVGGNLNVTGTSTFIGTLTASGESTFNNKVNFKGNGVELYHTSPYIDFHFNNSTTNYTSEIIEESSGIITIKPNLVVGSSATIPTATITTGTISNATIGSGIVTNLNVMDTLRATHYDLQTVAQLGGAFYVSPTVKFPTASNANIVVTKSGSTLTMVITDTSTITSTTMAGVVWQANAKIKASGKIGTVTTGTMDGTVTAVNVSSHSMTISVSGGNADGIQAGTYNKADIDNFCVMMYHTGSNPVGIMMNSYGTNGLTYIDIYGGSATSTYTTPNVRIGNLGGLVFNGSTLSNQWGIYTNNGYFSGKIIANGGTIGGFTIGDTAIYTGTLTSATDNYIGLSTADFTRSIGGTSRTGLRMAIGGKFGATGDGTIYSNDLQANGGNIAGWTISSSSLTKISPAIDNVRYSAVMQAPTDTGMAPTNVAFGVRTSTNNADWVYPFVVKYDGSLKATNADISGKITATSGSISGSLVTSGINANNISTGTIAIARLTSLKVGGRNLLLNTEAKNTITLTNATDNYYPNGSNTDSNGYYTESDYGKTITVGNTTDYFTVSFEWSSTSTTGVAWIQIEGNIVSNVATASGYGTRTDRINLGDSGNNDGKPCKYVATFKMTATQASKKQQRIRLRIAGTDTAHVAGSTFSIWNLKFEKGSTATEWSAAPEDIDADITDASKVATNYIYYDATNGLIISDSADSQTYEGASRGYNTQLTNDALNIRHGTDVLASYGSSVILGNKTAINTGTTVIPYPTHVEITPNSIELYKKTATSFTNIFSVGYGDALARKTEASKEYGTYLSLNENNHLESATYTTSLDMVSSTAEVLVQLRGIIKDTDTTVSDDSTDAIEIKPTEETNEAYAQYEGTLKLNDNDFSVDYTLDTITINETNRVMEFLSNYKTKYNIYIWISYLASNSDEIYHFDLGQRRSSTTYGRYSFITGYNNTASNTFSISMGQNNKNDGYKAFVNGESNEIMRGASCSSAFGEGLKIAREDGMVIGKYNSYTNGLFVVGNGTDNGNRQDAFVIRDRGKVYIYGDYAALTITPKNNDGRETAHPDFNGGILSLSPSLQHDDLCGYSIKNVNDKLSIYATPSRDKTTRNYYGESLYIQSFNLSGDKSTTEILRGVVLGRYDIQTTGYCISSLTSADTSYVATPTHTNSSPNRIIRKNGIVVVEIEFTPKKATTAWQTIFTVPSGFRPFITHRNTVQGTTFQITDTGKVQASTPLTTTAYHFYMVYPCKFPSNN